MPIPESQRRLSAILFTDAVGSSRVTGADEQEGLRLRDLHRALVRGEVERYGGRLIETPGDETLSTFESALDAVSAALAIREALRAEPGLVLHTGVHLGETLFRGGEVFGDGVNIAARIRQLAPPGEILVSGEVAYAIRNHREIEASPRGEHKLRNVDRPVTVFAVTGTPLPPAAAARVHRRAHSLSRSRLWLPGGALIALAAGAALQLARGRDGTGAVSPASPADSGIVAVMPFAVRGGDDLAYLREGMVELVSSKLSMSDEIRPVDPHSLLAFVSRELDGEVTPETAAEAARNFGASHFVLGSAVRVDDRLHLEASLYGAGAEPLRRVALQEDAEGLLGMIDGLATDLMKGLVQNTGRFDRLESATTRSPEALRAFLEGNAALRDWRDDDAAASFERAVALDPEFAFAWYRLSFSVLGTSQATRPRSSAFEAAERALALADRVPRREGELLRGYSDMLEGRLAEAEERYRRLVREAPDDWEAWNGLSEVLFHYNAYRGRSMLEALEPSERAMALDPDHPGPRVHIFVAAPTLGDSKRAREQAEWLVQNASDFGPTAQIWLAEASGNPEARARALERLASGGASHALGALATFPALRKDILELIRGAYPAVLQVARHLDSFLDARAGRLAAWRAAGIDRARYFGNDVAGLGNFPSAYLDAFPDIPASRADLEEQRLILRSMTVAKDSSPLDQGRRAYLVGLLSARLADASAVAASLAELEGLARPPGGAEAAAELATSLRGYAAWQRGEVPETLRLLETLPKRPLAKDFVSNGVYVRLLDRFLIGLALEAIGELERAACYHEYHALEASLAENVLDAPRALRRAKLYDKLGRRDEALTDYETFIALWAECDPELRPRVEEARARVTALRAAPEPTPKAGPRAPAPDGAGSQLRQ